MEKKQEEKIKMMLPLLNEKQRRIYLASEAIAMGRGGITEVSRVSGISRSVINDGIAATTTKNGLTIQCQLDLNQYPRGIKISDDELASINIVGDDFHPNWNYTISPQSTE